MPPDEDAFRSLRAELVAFPCPFERALLARCAACARARSTLLAERETIGCASAGASERCRAYRATLREKALFALRVESGSAWPFGKEIRLQCGGLLGLRRALARDEEGTPPVEERESPDEERGPPDEESTSPDEELGPPDEGREPPVEDADALLRAALERFGELDALPYSVIMRSVTGYSPRRRVRR